MSDRPRRRGFGSWVLLLLRVGVGAASVLLGLDLLGDRPAAAADFERWSLPSPDAFSTAIGVLGVVCGALLVLGLLTRLPALLLVCTTVGAMATAGRSDGGEQLVVPAALAVLSLILLVRGGGALQLIDAVDPDRGDAR